MIAKRPAGTHLSGYWEFPGGKKEEGETLQECLQREILEELGLHVGIKRFLCKVEHEYETKSISLYLFQCSEPEGEPAPLECESIAWVHPEELGSYPMPPADEKLILLVSPAACR